MSSNSIAHKVPEKKTITESLSVMNEPVVKIEPQTALKTNNIHNMKRLDDERAMVFPNSSNISFKLDQIDKNVKIKIRN